MKHADLTEAQRRVLSAIADNRGAAFTAWMLGRSTCEALRKRGLIEGDRPIKRWDGDPCIYITPAGLRALQESDPAAKDEAQ